MKIYPRSHIMSLTDRHSHRHCHCHCHCYCYCYCILLLVLVLVTGLVMMVLEVTWMCWRCSLGKSWAGTDNQSQSSLHHITAFPPGLTPAPPCSPGPLLQTSSNHRKSTRSPRSHRPEVRAERDTAGGGQVGAEVEISSWHHYQSHLVSPQSSSSWWW